MLIWCANIIQDTQGLLLVGCGLGYYITNFGAIAAAKDINSFDDLDRWLNVVKDHDTSASPPDYS